MSESHEKKIVTESGQTMRTAGIKKANRRRAKQGPTTTQIKRAVVKHLRAAGEGLSRLEGYDAEAQQIDNFADEMEGEWKI